MVSFFQTSEYSRCSLVDGFCFAFRLVGLSFLPQQSAKSLEVCGEMQQL